MNTTIKYTVRLLGYFKSVEKKMWEEMNDIPTVHPLQT